MSLSQLSNLIPLPEPELQQIIDYASTLSKQDAASHFSNLLGDSPQSVEFISSFNSRRKDPTSSVLAPASQSSSQVDLSAGVPKSSKPRKKKALPLGTPAPRQIQDTYVGQGTAYKKKTEDDYVSQRPTPPRSETPKPSVLDHKPTATQQSIARPPPSAAGPLISDLKVKSTSNSRHSSPAPQKTKVNIAVELPCMVPQPSSLSLMR